MPTTNRNKSQTKSGVSKISSKKRGPVTRETSKPTGKVITLRGIDPSLSQKIKSEAEKEHKSVNQFLVDTLKKNLGMGKKKKFTRIFHDLDNLFGKWSKKEFDQFQSQLEAQRAIDTELWR